MKKALLEHYPELQLCIGDADTATDIICECYARGGKLLICGNGGSMADAEHISGELLKGFLEKREIRGEMREKLIANNVDPDKLQGALAAIPLTSFPALKTAFENDCDGEYTFAQLTLALGRPGDVLLGISTSGKANNVAQAMRTARALGMKTIMLTGKKGEHQRGQYDCLIAAPASETYRVQEYHLPLYHYIAASIEKRIFGEK